MSASELVLCGQLVTFLPGGFIGLLVSLNECILAPVLDSFGEVKHVNIMYEVQFLNTNVRTLTFLTVSVYLVSVFISCATCAES